MRNKSHWSLGMLRVQLLIFTIILRYTIIFIIFITKFDMISSITIRPPIFSQWPIILHFYQYPSNYVTSIVVKNIKNFTL